LANCSDRRDKVENFISNESSFNGYKTVLVESCQSELIKAHSISKELEKDLRKMPTSQLTMLKMKKTSAENDLNTCVKNNLH